LLKKEKKSNLEKQEVSIQQTIPTNGLKRVIKYLQWFVFMTIHIDYLRILGDIGSVDNLLPDEKQYVTIGGHNYSDSFVECKDCKAFPVFAPRIKYNLNFPILRLKVTTPLDQYNETDYTPIIDHFSVRYN
jgi:hypothetical protein